MNKEETIVMIAERIKSEHRKHKYIEWERIAAYKIYASLNKFFNLHGVIARFFEITTEEVDMLKLLIQYKRDMETNEGEGLSDDEYDDYEGLKLWFENGL